MKLPRVSCKSKAKILFCLWRNSPLFSKRTHRSSFRNAFDSPSLRENTIHIYICTQLIQTGPLISLQYTSSGTVVASCCTDRIIEYIKYQIVFANATIHIQPICTSPSHRDTSENNSSFNFSDFSPTSL